MFKTEDACYYQHHRENISPANSDKVQDAAAAYRKPYDQSRTIITLSTQDFTSPQILSSNTCLSKLLVKELNIQPKTLCLQDYNHYMDSFSTLKRAGVRRVSKSEKKKIQIQSNQSLPFLMLVQSVSERNTLGQNGDSLSLSVLNFMEVYPFENIGLNLEYKSLSSCRSFKFQEEKKASINPAKAKNLYFQSFPSYEIVTSTLKVSIQCKFSLYLQSKYKALKSANIVQLSQIKEENPLHVLLFEAGENGSQIETPLTKSGVNLPTTQSSSERKENINESKLQNKPQYNFNMSKYFMFFLLQLLVKEHLEELRVTPSVQEAILDVTELLQKVSKRNEESKTSFYNHNHFNLLFLKINPKNQSTIEQNQNLHDMHKAVFKISNLSDNYVKNSMNIVKEHISRIIVTQLNVLQNNISCLNLESLNLDSDLKKDFEAKVDYFFRVKRAIAQLQSGKIVNRF